MSGLPDGGPPLTGPVEQTLTRDGILVRAGFYDDPFFFDLQGFRETRSTGTLSFVSSRSFFTGQNDTAIVFQIPRSRIETVDGTRKYVNDITATLSGLANALQDDWARPNLAVCAKPVG